MITISDIFSRVQSNINDIEGNRIQLAEWIDLAQFVAMDIAEVTQSYISRYWVTPNPSSAPIDPAPNYAILPIFDPVLAKPDYAPFRLLKVARGYIVDQNNVHTATRWAECFEYSSQAILSTITGTFSFPINNTALGKNAFTTQFVNPTTGLTDGNMYLLFAKAFELDEAILIDFVSNRPWGTANDSRYLVTWSPNDANPQTVPDYLRNVFEWGLTWRALNSFYLRGDETMVNRVKYAKDLFDKYMSAAASYSRNLRDNSSVLMKQPLNWLPAKYEQ